jgi:hypothetical protein
MPTTFATSGDLLRDPAYRRAPLVRRRAGRGTGDDDFAGGHTFGAGLLEQQKGGSSSLLGVIQVILVEDVLTHASTLFT